MSRQIIPVILLISVAWWLGPLRAEPIAPGAEVAAKSPEESLQCLRVHPDFRVELVAAEPLVVDPIAIAWGVDGKLWVVEMGGYPNAADGGRIRFLQDGDRDGRFDRSTVFLDGLSFPTGVLPWKEGILVTCAPDIVYAEDNDGDGKADMREVLFTGFGQGNPQHCINGLRWGLDNWVHCSNGDSGGLVRSRATGERISILGYDVRVCPRRGLIERLTEMSQFGRCRDDWGNWFGCSSLWPSWHVVLENRYLRRNAHLRNPKSIQHLMDPPTGARVYPVNRDLPRYNEPELANRFTSACGIAVYRDNLFGTALADNYFVCEPAHNLVRREVMHRDGVSFKSRGAAEEQQEFLASSDPCFRPTQVRTGPDGAVWCVDMYRAVIEHPEYMPDHSGLRLRYGSQAGRIYRVVPAHAPLRPVPRLDQLGTRVLAHCLDTPNGPVRDLVQQRLVERQDPSAVEVLEQLARHGDQAAVRVSALCTLDGLGAAQPSTLIAVLADPHPAVRRHAVRISEPMLDDRQALQSAVLKLVEDADPRVRLQLACSLGQWKDIRAGQALARMAGTARVDPFIATAVLSSATNHTLPMLRALARECPDGQQVNAIKTLTRYALADYQEEAIALALAQVATPAPDGYRDWQLEVLADFLDALKRQASSLNDLHRNAGAELREAIDQLSPTFDSARSLVLDEDLPASRRALAARVLGGGLDRRNADLAKLAGLLTPRSPARLQEAVVDTLVRTGDAAVPGLLLDSWRNRTPAIRIRVLDAILSRAEWADEFLDHVESGRVSATTVPAVHRGKLLLHNKGALRRRAGKLLESSRQAPRDLVERYLAASQVPGSKAAGKELFRVHCSNCHLFQGVGSEVGPDLNTIRDRSPRKLMSDLFDPNRVVEPRYATYVAETVDGRVYSGILKSTSGDSITLVADKSKGHLLLNSELARLESTERSLMPEDWDRLLSVQDVANLIEYLRHGDTPRSR